MMMMMMMMISTMQYYAYFIVTPVFIGHGGKDPCILSLQCQVVDHLCFIIMLLCLSSF